jgi:acyl-ACP thioesterase
MQVYKIEQETAAYLCDRKDRLQPWAAVRLCQEISEAHSMAMGVGYEELMRRNSIWILSRAYYNIYKRPKAFEKIMLSTWSRGTDGLFAFRDYRMTDESGETLLTGTTYWPMIDFTTRKPIRLKEIMSHYECCTDEATDHSVLERLKLPDMENPDGSFESPARYSMIDHAQHVNNAEYVRLVFDSLMQTDFDLDKPFGLELNYQHETHPGETLSVLRKQQDCAVWIQISNSRGLSVVAKVTYLN